MSEVFISYAWGGESEDIANTLEQTFQEKGIKLVRDKTDLGYKGLIREFMQQLGQGKCVVAVISDKYLKSKNCMYELLEISRNGEFYDRIFPIVLNDACLDNAIEQLNYIEYWEGKIKELEERMRRVSQVNLQGIREEIDRYAKVREKIAGLVNTLGDMNTLTLQMHQESGFGEMVDAIAKRLKADIETRNDPLKQLHEPIFPETLKRWEEQRIEWVDRLFKILEAQIDYSLFFVNSFLLSSKFLEEFVLDKLELKEKLKALSIKPVFEGICPLIACSEWCKLRFWESIRQDKLKPTQIQKMKNCIQQIESWKDQVIKSREGVDLNKILSCVEEAYEEFKKLIKQEEFMRIQIEIEPIIDEKNNTGQKTGEYSLMMNLWIKNKELPLGRFAENILLNSLNNRLIDCLQEEDLLPNLIRKTRFSLPESVKFKIEFFLPFDFWQDSYETICFQYGRQRKPLGQEYPIFINSFERYFDEDFREIRVTLEKEKNKLWTNNNILDSKLYYIGTEPDLLEIESELAIAVWRQKANNPLVEEVELKLSEWQEWPHTIHELRKGGREVTLFWDDLYPKPSKRTRPLNPKVVE